ncbi:MAG TPA: CoA transferase [Acidimicrobiales bacterium]|nr:CoA transferase [Acidimicrobiales bacterium]
MPSLATSARWAASGAQALTGDAVRPGLVAPRGVVERIVGLGEPLGIDALALLGERAAIAGLARRGSVSCGGATRLLPGPDGAWLAVSLARDDDVAAVPAWLGLPGPPPPDELWTRVAEAVAATPPAGILDGAATLGLPVARVGETPPGPAVVAERIGEGPPLRRSALVVDLSSLWAGPLCTRLLARGGARVVKVESLTRPDGARRGPAAFFALLHAGQRAVALDLATAPGRERLRALVAAADVVVEGSRPRALAQLGIAPDADGPQVWVSITGHGRTGPGGDRVAFGDDAAAAGGLVAWGSDGAPRFVADAVADPLAGVAAAGATARALAAGGRWLVDVALARVAATVAGDREEWDEGDPGVEAPPTARPPAGGPPPELGEHTAEVLAELGID